MARTKRFLVSADFFLKKHLGSFFFFFGDAKLSWMAQQLLPFIDRQKISIDTDKKIIDTLTKTLTKKSSSTH
jgi:hypothetical protein